MPTSSSEEVPPQGGDQEPDIWSRLLSDRIVYIGDSIDDHLAGIIVAQILYLEQVDSESDINVYIQSPGGSVTAGLAIYDVMRAVKPDICTTVVGMAAGVGATLASAGTKGKRFAMANSRILICHDSVEFSGTPSEIATQCLEFKHKLGTVSRILAENCGRSVDQIEEAFGRPAWMTPSQAIAYGLIDEVPSEPISS
jgi:ATP-dependent Clp protease protease subunit